MHNLITVRLVKILGVQSLAKQAVSGHRPQRDPPKTAQGGKQQKHPLLHIPTAT